MRQKFSVSCFRLFVLILVPLVLFSTGCSMKNATVVDGKRVALSSQTERSEVYTSGALTVTYEYKRSGDKLTISGNIEFRQSVDSLDVRIVFIDATGLVLGKKIVYSSGFRSLASTDSTRTFRTKLEIPSGTAGFSFIESNVPRRSRR